MIIKPLAPATRMRPVVFIVDAGPSWLEVCTESGWTERVTNERAADLLLLRQMDNAVYSLVQPKRLVSCCGHNRWEVIKYHNRTVRCIYLGVVSVYPFSTFGQDPQALLPFFDAIRDLGVAPSSMSQMAANSWRRSLHHPVWLQEWQTKGEAGRAAFYGGRKEALEPTPSIYSGAKYVDLSAAYLQAMRASIPTHIRPVDPNGTNQHSGNPTMGIVQGALQLPAQRWGPLPFYVARGKRGTHFTSYGYGSGEGAWVSDEWALAIEAGASDIKIGRVWSGHHPQPIFEQWLPWAFQLRRLDGVSGLAAKFLTTRLWSMFAINPESHKREVISFDDKMGRRKRKVEAKAGGSRFGQATFVAAIIAARVRIRLYRELLASPGAVFCDTDGGIVPDVAREHDGWRKTRDLAHVEIKGAQAFRWQCPDCGVSGGHPPWHYSVAGFPSDSPLCEGLFKYAVPRQQYWDIGPYSLTLPAGELSEVKRQAGKIEVLPAPLEEESL